MNYYRYLNQLIKSGILLILLLITRQGYPAESHQPDRISINFYQAQTSIILQSLAEQQQLNLVFNDNIDPLQTIKLNNVKWIKALDVVTQSAKLQYQIDDNLLLVNPLPDPKIIAEQKLQQQKYEELKLPLSHLSVAVNHAEPKTISTMVSKQNLLSERGKIFIDDRTHNLIIYDIEPNLPKIATLIKQLDRPIPQIHIAAHIVTMSTESADELGIKWGYTKNSSQFIQQLDINMGVSNAPATIGFNLAKRSSNLLNLELSALEAENQLEIIASPNLLTSHQHTAYIKQGTEIPYEVSGENNGTTTIEFKQAVLGLEVTPRVLTEHQLELTLSITQNTIGRSIKRSDGGEALAINTQEIHTQVLVNNNETLILGGIFQQSHNQNQQAVPGISHVPVVGELFKYRGKQWQKRELIIFITPQLVY